MSIKTQPRVRWRLLLPRLRQHWRVSVGSTVLLAAAVAVIAGAAVRAQTAPPPPAGPAPPVEGAGESAETPPPGSGEAPSAPSPNVRIVFKVVPPSKATVTWGKKKLGIIKPKAPLIIARPRDSGPLDVVVRAEGCIPVHTRAYTFTDSTVAVKVTPVDKKNTLFGYREELPPETDAGVLPVTGSPDGGTSIGSP